MQTLGIAILMFLFVWLSAAAAVGMVRSDGLLETTKGFVCLALIVWIVMGL